MLVLSHHKCATNWLYAYLLRYCELNALSFSITHLSFGGFDPDAQVVCLINADYALSTDLPGPKLHVLRSPLDLVVSAYHSHLVSHPTHDWPELAEQRERLRAVGKDEGIMRTIAFLERRDFGSGTIGPLYSLQRWNFEDSSIATVRMEDAVSGNGSPLGAWLQAARPASHLPDPADFSFERFSGRQPGEIDDSSHYRAGIAGRWRKELPETAIDYLCNAYRPIFERFYPDDLS